MTRLSEALSFLLSQILQLPAVVESQQIEIRRMQERIDLLENKVYNPKRRKKS